jgi:hypothetical protein
MNEAVFLHGSRVVRRSYPFARSRIGETLIDVWAFGIRGSDLHDCRDGGIGSAVIHGLEGGSRKTLAEAPSV